MMRAVKKALIGAFGALILTGPAMAEGYSTVDLGLINDKPACMAKAERVMNRYKNTFGAHSVKVGGWTTFGWDFEPGDQDVVILCVAPTSSSNSKRRGVMVTHGSGTEKQRFATRDLLQGYWDAD